MHWRRKWQPTPVFLSRESQGRGSLVGCRLWGRTESDTTEVTQQQQQQQLIAIAHFSLAKCPPPTISVNSYKNTSGICAVFSHFTGRRMGQNLAQDW